MSNAAGSLIGIDLGGTAVKGLRLHRDGTIEAETSLPTRDGEVEGNQPAFAFQVRRVVQELSPESGNVSIGLCAPGLAARDRRSIDFMPGRLKGLEGLNWTESLHAARPVCVLNDAQAALLGERWTGAAQGSDHVILLTLGTGVGGAAMVDGQLLHGRIGRAGHLGHLSVRPDGPAGITGLPGTLEETLSLSALDRHTKPGWSSTDAFLDAVNDADTRAKELWDYLLRDFARGIASLVNILDPETILLGGGLVHRCPRLLPDLTGALEPFEWRPGGQRVRLAAAQLGNHAGAIGAAFAALQSNQNPTS